MLTLHLPNTLPSEGFKVPIVASFAGFKHIPILAFAHNSATPSFLLYADGVEHKVWRGKRRSYAEIESLGISQLPLTQNFVLTFKNSLITFSGNLLEVEDLRVLVDYLSRRGVPLTADAQKLVSGT